MSNLGPGIHSKLTPAQRFSVIVPMYLALAAEPLYAVFFYLAARGGADDLMERYNITTEDWEDNGISGLLVIGTVCQALQQWITTNPAEATLAFYAKRRQPASSRFQSLPDCAQSTINKPLLWLTLAVGYTAFAIGSLSATIPLATLMPNAAGRWTVNTLLVLLGLVFYYLLAHQDLVRHNSWIYGWLLDKTRSIFISMCKSPLMSLEVFLEIGCNVLYRSLSAAYIVQDFLQVNNLVDFNTTHSDYGNSSTTAAPTEDAVGALPAMSIAVGLTAYTTLFTRLHGYF